MAQSIKDLRKLAGERFFLSRTESVIKDDVRKAAQEVGSPYRETAAAFLSALEGAVSTVSIPVVMASLAVLEIEGRMETIRQLVKSGKESDEIDRESLQAQVDEEISRTVTGKESSDRLAAAAMNLLLLTDVSPEFSPARVELLRQGAVLFWGAFEAAARDLVVRYLDASPVSAVELLASTDGRRLFGNRSLDFDTLQDAGFDLSNRMGQLVAGFHDLASLQAIRTVCSVLFPTDLTLRVTLRHPDLWFLAQRRHLIVHRSGVVDRRYKEATGDDAEVGTKVVVTPDELSNYLTVVQDAWLALLRVVSSP